MFLRLTLYLRSYLLSVLNLKGQFALLRFESSIHLSKSFNFALRSSLCFFAFGDALISSEANQERYRSVAKGKKASSLPKA